VMGVLACTRAIGDHDLEGYGVTAEPEVLTWERQPSDECLILASDGLWDKVGSQVGGVNLCSMGTAVQRSLGAGMSMSS
jgi:serine/threonine protein phosphatase PrpC